MRVLRGVAAFVKLRRFFNNCVATDTYMFVPDALYQREEPFLHCLWGELSQGYYGWQLNLTPVVIGMVRLGKRGVCDGHSRLHKNKSHVLSKFDLDFSSFFDSTGACTLTKKVCHLWHKICVYSSLRVLW